MMFFITATLYASKKEVETEAWAAVARYGPATSFSRRLLPFAEKPNQIILIYSSPIRNATQSPGSGHSHQIFHSPRSNPSSKQSFRRANIRPPQLRLNHHRHLCLARLVLSTFVLNARRDTANVIGILDHIPPAMTTVNISVLIANLLA